MTGKGVEGEEKKVLVVRGKGSVMAEISQSVVKGVAESGGLGEGRRLARRKNGGGKFPPPFY